MTCEFGRPGTGLFGLPPRTGPNGSAEELDRVYFQDIGQLPDDLQAHIGHRPLNPAHVGPVDSSVMGQLLLGQLPLMAESPKIGRKKLA
jgi:hypothetical protein